ncbi:MAG TPA: response regulator [Hyphomicrobiaceae bacterium]|nr:response regulator [Hyphomicrobiaceae bacterium]
MIAVKDHQHLFVTGLLWGKTCFAPGAGHRARGGTDARRLKDLGYRVLVASHGAEALTILAGTPDIEIVFFDLVMPGGVSGFDLAREVRKRFPHVRLILTSGYSAELINQQTSSSSIRRCCASPTASPSLRVCSGRRSPTAPALPLRALS